MVGGPNAGSPFGRRQLWRVFVDIFTNFFAHPTSQASAATSSHDQALQSMATLIRAVVSAESHDLLVPGLMAMDPRSEYLAELNRPQASDWQRPDYCVIATDFEPTAADPPFHRAELLWWKAVDRLVDGAFTDEAGKLEGNDIAVGVSSMPMVDGKKLSTVFTLPQSSGTTHVTYFRNGDVVSKLREWLKLDESVR